MNARIASVAALLLALVIPLKSFAEDQTKLTPAQIADGRSKAQVANTLIIIGRSAKDPDMLLVAAKLLSTVEAPVADPKARQPTASRSSTTSTVWSQRRRATPPTEAPNRLRSRGTIQASAITNISAIV